MKKLTVSLDDATYAVVEAAARRERLSVKEAAVRLIKAANPRGYSLPVKHAIRQ